MLGLPEAVHACLFDLDGVLTDTASVHTKAWKAMFDSFLAASGPKTTGEKFVPFDADKDYRKYVDGKKREDGVRSFLASRGIELPDGDPDDPADKDTVYGLGHPQKRRLPRDPAEGRRQGVRRFAPLSGEGDQAAGLATAVVSSSANTRRGAGDHRPRQVHPAACRRRDPARGTHRGQAGAGLLPACRRAARTSSPPRRRCSKTRCPVSSPAVPATSMWSALIA